MPASHQEQQRVLLVDDEEKDVLLTRLALERAGLELSVYSVPGGQEAIAYLNGDPPYQGPLSLSLTGVGSPRHPDASHGRI